MNINDWEEPPDGAGNHTNQPLVINWQLILWIERQYQEQRELARQFEEELDTLFRLINSPESTSEELPDPPDWPDL